MKVEKPIFDFNLVRRLLHVPQHMPSKFQIEITNRCNLNCKLCPREKFNLPVRDMNITLFEQILAKLKNVEIIIPVGWGESFLHEEFDRIIRIVKSNGFLIKLPTNGVCITNDLNTEIALGVDFLTFSLDEWHNNKTVDLFNIISLLIYERKRRNVNIPYITVQSVLNESNSNIRNIITAAKSVGVDRVNIIRPNIYGAIESPTWKNRKRVYKEADLLGKKLKIRVDMFEYALFRGIKRWLWKYFKWMFRINSWCPRLSDFMYVTVDGKVTPCCYLPRFTVGDLLTQSVFDIWHGKEMNKFRKEHNRICKNCQILKIK